MVTQNLNEKSYKERIICSIVNKKIFVNECKDIFIDAKPDLEGINIINNIIFTDMLKHYVGDNEYYALVDKYKNDN